MLLWEKLVTSLDENATRDVHDHAERPRLSRAVRLPFDKRCTAQTKKGSRCKGRIYKDSDYCFFHDPSTAAQRRTRSLSPAARGRRRLTHLPDGYLRKLKSLTAVGEAMDRLYREVRLGVITPEMGDVLFNILSRLQDSGLVSTGAQPGRTRAARVRPKLKSLLTRKERAAWNRAVDHALTRSKPVDGRTVSIGDADAGRVETERKRRVPDEPTPAKPGQHPADDSAVKLKLQAAS